MAVSTRLNNKYVKPADAKASAKSSYESGKIGMTKRGTAIVDKNSGMGKDAFLKLLVAQMKNMDPTQNQDSTAYVAQMAQFASIEQMNNLNTTMQDFAYEQMVGKVAILNEKDADGKYKYGIISQIVKNGTTTTATILDAKTGTSSDYSMNKIIGTSDSGYGAASYETALNSSFSSAATLAKDKATAVYVETKIDEKKEVNEGQNITVTTTTKKAYKCNIEKAYLDKQNSVVKVTIKLDDGTTKTVNYDTIAVAGKELSNEVVEKAIKDNTFNEPIVVTNTASVDTNSSSAISQNTNENIGTGNENSTENTDNTKINDENKFLAGFGV
ncbi:MAG: flagellar biosynthesis protein FlgD [Clostridium butyricum]|nr:flagellar biosynthesis protein FlgD [Clostridium butyricum]